MPSAILQHYTFIKKIPGGTWTVKNNQNKSMSVRSAPTTSLRLLQVNVSYGKVQANIFLNIVSFKLNQLPQKSVKFYFMYINLNSLMCSN